jgi:hypothetical protein
MDHTLDFSTPVDASLQSQLVRIDEPFARSSA